jgi:hypothetical protein
MTLRNLGKCASTFQLFKGQLAILEIMKRASPPARRRQVDAEKHRNALAMPVEN